MILEIALICLLAAAVFFAVRYTLRKARKGGGCCPEHEETVKRTGTADRNRRHYPYTLKLKLGGMTCENCARRIENVLNSLDGVWASVDTGSRSAVVRCKSEPDVQLLSRTVAEAGYAVLEVM